MKITFEGKTFGEILDQMQDVLALPRHKLGPTVPAPKSMPDFVFEGPGPATPKEVTHVDKPGSNPVPKPGRTEKQKANDERLRERALAKKAAGLKVGDRMPKASGGSPTPQKVKPQQMDLPIPPPEEPAAPVDPVEVVNIRNKTITDLQEAYANGHQQEVFELLSRFGNGAKSFRELPPEAFLPISQAIAKGALT